MLKKETMFGIVNYFLKINTPTVIDMVAVEVMMVLVACMMAA